MYPIIFKIGQFTFYTHGLFALLGIVFGAATIYYLARARKLDTSFFIDNIIFTVFFGILGAKLVYLLLYWDQFADIKQIFEFWNTGLVSYGGFVAGGMALYFILKRQKAPILSWLDISSLGLLVGLFFGRIGEIFAGDIDSIPSSSFLAINHQMPVSLFEAIYVMIILIILLFRFLGKHRVEGETFWLLLIMYPACRFFNDFFRTDAKLILNFSLGQVFSLVLAVTSLIFYLFFIKGKRREFYAIR